MYSTALSLYKDTYFLTTLGGKMSYLGIRQSSVCFLTSVSTTKARSMVKLFILFFSVLPSKFHSEMKIIPTTHIHSWNLLDTSISSEFRTGHTKRGNEAFVPSFFVSLFLSSSFTPHAPPLQTQSAIHFFSLTERLNSDIISSVYSPTPDVVLTHRLNGVNQQLPLRTHLL